MIALSDWWVGGRRHRIENHDIFVRDNGAGETIVFLHGFPTSSHDWSDVIADLSRDHRCLTFDYLGYGASDKPMDADYSSYAQTARVIALLRTLRVSRATLVGHDLGGIVLQQLVHAHHHGQLDLAIDRAIFVNSSVYPDLYRPTPTQMALIDPALGKRVAAQITADSFRASIASLFSSHAPTHARLDALWAAVSRDEGQLIWPAHLVYMAERAERGGEWLAAMRETRTPLAFVYGLADAISGAQILEQAHRDLPHAQCIGLPALGHYPQVEAPGDVSAALRTVLRADAAARG